MFENPFDLFSDQDGLMWIAQEITHHAHPAGLWQFDKNGDIRTVLLQRRMRGMPRAFPTEDAAGRFDLGPREIEGVTVMAYPFRPELPGGATIATLHEESAIAQAGPIGCRKAIRLADGNG